MSHIIYFIILQYLLTVRNMSRLQGPTPGTDVFEVLASETCTCNARVQRLWGSWGYLKILPSPLPRNYPPLSKFWPPSHPFFWQFLSKKKEKLGRFFFWHFLQILAFLPFLKHFGDFSFFAPQALHTGSPPLASALPLSQAQNLTTPLSLKPVHTCDLQANYVPQYYISNVVNIMDLIRGRMYSTVGTLLVCIINLKISSFAPEGEKQINVNCLYRRIFKKSSPSPWKTA